MGWALARYNFAKQFLASDARILDAGCGSGFGGAILGNYCATYIGIDEQPVIERVLARGRYQGSNIQFIPADLNSNFPPLLPSPTFVIAFEVLEHLANPEHFLRNVHKLLATTGSKSPSLLLSTPLNPNNAPFQKADHLKEYSLPGLEHLLNQTGFRIERSWSWGIPFGMIYRQLAKRGKPVFRPGFDRPRTSLSRAADWVPALSRITYLPVKYGLFGTWGVSQMVLARPNRNL